MARGWHAIAGNAAAWPNSARLARAELHDWGHAPEPSPADRCWLGAEAAAAALQARGEAWPEGHGPDEALCRLREAAAGPLDTGALLAMARAAGHSEAEAVAVAVAAFAESGAALTAAQAVDLKVTLWRSSPRCGALSACRLRRPSATSTAPLAVGNSSGDMGRGYRKPCESTSLQFSMAAGHTDDSFLARRSSRSPRARRRSSG